MSLRTWQETWLRLMLAPERLAQILAEQAAELSPAELAALQTLPPERLQAIAGAVQRGRVSVLAGSLPASLRRACPDSTALASRYAAEFPAVAVYPPAQGLKPWLQWLAQQPEVLADPCLVQLIHAEICLCTCVFYAPPESEAPETPGPRLAPCAGLVVAGPDLETLLNTDKPYTAGRAEPLQGWLLARGPTQIHCLPLHWGLYELLQRLDGKRSESEALALLLAEYPELASEQEALLAWPAWLRRQEWLL